MNRFRILAGFPFLCLMATFLAAQQPNLVLIVSDDHGFGDIGWNNSEVRSPHLVQLAREGVRLDRFYANPICSVTRAALLTGLASLRTGVNNSSGLDLKYRTLPQALREAGYQTWMCGKWHLGGSEDSQRSGPEYLPTARGFDYFYGHLHGAIDYYRHERKDLGKLDWQRNGQPIVEEGFSTDLLANDAVRLVKQRDRNRPFFLYLAFNAVHGPLQAPPATSSQSKTPRGKREILLANVEAMDAAIGRLMKTLDDEQLQQQTLVLFLGDNGGQLNQGANNGNLRGEKGTTFEGGIRVPAVIRWTGKLPAGTVSEQFLSVMDVFPTLCEAAQVNIRPAVRFDGASVWPGLVAGERQNRPPFVMGNRDVACFDPPYKLVIPGGNTQPLLFDLLVDPSESHDLATQHPEVVTRLTKVVDSIGTVKGTRNQQDSLRKRKGNRGKTPSIPFP